VAGLNPAAPLDQSGFHESLTATAAWSSATVPPRQLSEYLFSWAATEGGKSFLFESGQRLDHREPDQ